MRIHSAKPRKWGGMAALGVLALVVAISGLILVQGDVGAAGTFNPAVGVDLSDYEHEANADIATTFEVPGTDYNYSTLVSFTPVQFFPDEEVPIGARAGTLDALATLGLVNGACNTPLSPHFDLLWASTDPSDTCTFAEQFQDSSTPGLKRGTVLYPDFVARILPGITPVERLWGWASVSGQLVSINFLTLEPGDLPGYSAAWGRPSVTILNDIGDPAAVPTPGDAITDFCTPLSSDTVYFGLSQDNPLTAADEAGYQVRRNPDCGATYTFRWYTASMLDAEGDGYENYGDTCPFDVNNENFKEVAGHGDQDGIDSACDPAPSSNCWPGAPGLGPGGSFLDCDKDGFSNRGDNCPQVANADQADGDVDDIGDACDTEGNGPTVPDGTPIQITKEVDVEISGPPCGGEEATPTPSPTPSPTPTGTVVAGVETTLAEDAEAGDTEIAVTDTTGFAVDDQIEIGTGDTKETNTITAISGGSAGTFTLATPLEFDHAAGEAVVKVAAVVLTPTPTATVEVEICAPVFPGTYNGLVRINGQPAASGYEITASIGDVQWGSDIVSGGRYAMDIPNYMPSQAPCFEGGTLSFALNGMTCTPTAEWASGIQTVDLSCAPAAPAVTPTPTVTPEVTPQVTPQVTPVKPPPSGAGGLSGSGPGLPLWAMALTSWAGLTIVAGLGTLLAVKRG